MPRIMPCPSCAIGVQVPDHLLGQRVRCSGCGVVFTPEADAPPPSPPVPSSPPPDTPHIQAETPRERADAQQPPARRRSEEEDDRPWERNRRWEEEEDDRPWERRPRRYRPSLGEARSKVSVPGTLLQVYGILLCLAGLLSLVGLGVAIFLSVNGGNLKGLNNGGPDLKPADILPLAIGGGIGAVFGLSIGTVVILAGTRMKALRSYGLAMTGAILSLVSALLSCVVCGLFSVLVIPVALGVGIWSLVVLQDVNVREAFQEVRNGPRAEDRG